MVKRSMIPARQSSFEHNDGAANERKLKGANARHETPQRLLRLVAQQRPEPGGERAEGSVGDQRAVALARPAGLDDVDEAAGPRRHHADAVGQHAPPRPAHA